MRRPTPCRCTVTTRRRRRGQAQTLTFVPYFAWANRGEGEMRVWVDASGDD
ncbi:hypothetical protein K8O61_06785 [Xanthomonas cerealis pv. cerealis]|nr:hypothetical protein [Xanthomonas translucens]UKE71444.1 hypothetical protein K8O61_06785 [Xanthomonas translucens pv. pistacia]